MQYKLYFLNQSNSVAFNLNLEYLYIVGSEFQLKLNTKHLEWRGFKFVHTKGCKNSKNLIEFGKTFFRTTGPIATKFQHLDFCKKSENVKCEILLKAQNNYTLSIQWFFNNMFNFLKFFLSWKAGQMITNIVLLKQAWYSLGTTAQVSNMAQGHLV